MKKKGALLVSVTMVLVAVLALTTASFAWFSASLNPTVADMEIGVTSSNALLISAQASTGFKTKLEYADLKTGGNMLADYNGTGTAFTADHAARKLTAATPAKDVVGSDSYYPATPSVNDPLVAKPSEAVATATTTYGLDFMKANDGATWGAGFDATQYKSVGANDDLGTSHTTPAQRVPGTMFYVKFDLYFRASTSFSNGVSVSLDLSSTGAGSAYDGTTVTGKADPALTGSDQATQDIIALQKQVDKIARIAFVVPTAAVGVNPQTGSKVIVFEPNSGIIASLAGVVNYDKTLPYKTEGGNTNGTTAVGTDIALFDMANNAVNKMTVYIWLEGNDAECDNIVSGGSLATMLKFVAAAKA